MPGQDKIGKRHGFRPKRARQLVAYLEPGQVNDRNGRLVCLPLRARVEVVLRLVLTRAADDRVGEVGELVEVKHELFGRL